MEIKDTRTLAEYLKSAEAVGFQASRLGQARELLRELKSDQDCKVFLGFTANLVASGMRGYITRIIRSGMVDAVVTTGGAIDHDVIKSVGHYELGSFQEDDQKLHARGMNRIGNILVGNKRYEALEKISYEVMEKAMNTYGNSVAPSELISEYGKWIKRNSADQSSFLMACEEEGVPVFSPGITDSAIGLHTYFFKQKRTGKEFGIDVTKDMKKLADIAINAERTGAIVLGGGIAKHHIIGVNILKGGLDYAIYITTAQEYDGSLSGAETREGVSWGKIKGKQHCTVHSDVTIALPLLVEGIL